MKTALAIFHGDANEIFTISRDVSNLKNFASGPIGRSLTDQEIATYICDEAEMDIDDLYEMFIFEADGNVGCYCAYSDGDWTE